MTISTLPEKRVVKCIFWILIYCSLSLKAQTPPIDLEDKSIKLLQTKVDYRSAKPSLKETLKSLSFQNNLNIIFSSTTLGDIKAAKATTGKMELGSLLSLLLKDTGFDYVVVGQSIAIVENVSKPAAPQDSLYSSTATSPPSLQRHIVSEKTQTFDHISKKDRRMVRALLLKELNNYGLELEESRDTIVVKPIENKTRYGIGISAGCMFNKVHTRSMVSYDWISELRYQQKTSPGISLGIHGISHKGSYFAFLGFTLQRLKTEIAWAEMKKNGAQVELPGTSKAEKIKYLNATDRFTILSMPMGLGYSFKFNEAHALAPMFSLDLFAVLSSQVGNLSKFKDYYKVKSAQENYSEKVRKLGMSSTLSLRYSYTYRKPYTLIADLGYRIGLSPFMSNSIFKSSHRGLLCTLGLNYWL